MFFYLKKSHHTFIIEKWSIEIWSEWYILSGDQKLIFKLNLKCISSTAPTNLLIKSSFRDSEFLNSYNCTCSVAIVILFLDCFFSLDAHILIFGIVFFFKKKKCYMYYVFRAIVKSSKQSRVTNRLEITNIGQTL